MSVKESDAGSYKTFTLQGIDTVNSQVYTDGDTESIMKPTNLSRIQFLDGEKLFRLYWEDMGTSRSVAKLVNFCVSEGWTNPRTGKPPTRMGVWKAMWSWALKPENLQKSRQMFNDGMIESGILYTKEEWKEFVTTKARGGLELGRRRYRAFEEAIG